MKLTISLAQIEVANSQPEMNLSKGQRLIAEAAPPGKRCGLFPGDVDHGL